jgi:hypothetical protein
MRNYKSFFSYWSTYGKYEKLKDAAKALQHIAKDPKHIYHNYEFRVVMKRDDDISEEITEENLALMLMYGKEEKENGNK